jgi:hypothetical protein
MSYVTLVFEEQLNKLETAESSLRQSEKDLSKLVCTGMYTDRATFQTTIRDFGSQIITSVQAIQQPVGELPALKPEELTVNPEGREVEKPRTGFGYPQAGLLAVGIVACLILAVYGLIPPMTGVYVIIACIGLSFGPGITSFISRLLRKEDLNAGPKPLDDWIAESLQWMLDQYDGTRYLAKVQNQKAEDLPNYVLLNIPEELYNREKQNADTLPGEFLGRIIKIMVECNKAFTIRRAMIFSAIAAAKQAAFAEK